jgi:hypothetical protein
VLWTTFSKIAESGITQSPCRANAEEEEEEEENVDDIQLSYKWWQFGNRIPKKQGHCLLY